MKVPWGRQAALAHQRHGLKVGLWKERAWPEDGFPRCPWCGEAITRPDDCVMHEALVKRSALPRKFQHKIFVGENSVLCHFSCHDRHGQTREFKARTKTQLERYYGWEHIKAWVESLGLKQAVGIPEIEMSDEDKKRLEELLDRIDAVLAQRGPLTPEERLALWKRGGDVINSDSLNKPGIYSKEK